jgi:NO-binding membrane sensor protein with MHYT domain
MSSGVALMHYTGMVAMDVSPSIVWNYRRATLPIIIAVLVSFAALWLTFRLRHEVALAAPSLTEANKELAQLTLQNTLTRLP